MAPDEESIFGFGFIPKPGAEPTPPANGAGVSQSDFQRLQTQVNNLQTDLNNTKNALNQEKTKVNTLNTKVANLNQQLNNAFAQIRKLENQKIPGLEGRIVDLEAVALTKGDLADFKAIRGIFASPAVNSQKIANAKWIVDPENFPSVRYSAENFGSLNEAQISVEGFVTPDLLREKGSSVFAGLGSFGEFRTNALQRFTDQGNDIIDLDNKIDVNEESILAKGKAIETVSKKVTCVNDILLNMKSNLQVFKNRLLTTKDSLAFAEKGFDDLNVLARINVGERVEGMGELISAKTAAEGLAEDIDKALRNAVNSISPGLQATHNASSNLNNAATFLQRAIDEIKSC